MNKLLPGLVMLCLLSIPAIAQDVPKFEVFGGYSLLRDSGNDDLDTSETTLNGFAAAFEANIHPNIGIVGEFNFYQDTESWTEYEYAGESRWRHMPFLFGPRFNYRKDKFRVFGHYLLGAVRSSYLDKGDDGSVWEDWSDTNFGQAIGGGLDIVLNKTISIRPAQIDWLSVKISDSGEDWSVDTWNRSFRYSGGIVFTFGSR